MIKEEIIIMHCFSFSCVIRYHPDLKEEDLLSKVTYMEKILGSSSWKGKVHSALTLFFKA